MAIRILHIVTNMDRGGLETLLMNCYRHIDREKVQFDFLVHRYTRAAYDDEIEEMGGIIYRLPRLNPVSIRYKQKLISFFKNHPEYKIVHCHLDCMSGIPLGVAKDCGIPVRIAHSHNSNQDRNWKYVLKRYYMKQIPNVATHYFACSQKAGEFMFPGQNTTIIKNGIETKLFSYDPSLKNSVRKELDIENKLVVGHIGRFMPQKNHIFLIDVFHKLQDKEPDAVLLLVGQGALEEKIREKVWRLGLTDKVKFLGLRSDVNRILQAVDVFVMPSLYEGLGIAAVEAQTSGLYCAVSNEVPKDCGIIENVEFLPLDMPASLWAEHILDGAKLPRMDQSKIVAAKGYDIRETADYLQKFYIKMW